MTLHIMSRLHELYESVFHRGDPSRSAVPEPLDDTMPTLRMVRDDVEPDIVDIDVEQLADGDAYDDDTREPATMDDDDDDGRNWVEALETRAAENGPGPEHAVAPDERRNH